MLRIYLIIFLFVPLFLKSETEIYSDHTQINYELQYYTLKGNIKLSSPRLSLNAENLIYKKKTGEFFASNNVKVYILEHQTTIESDFLENSNSLTTFSSKKDSKVVTTKKDQTIYSNKLLMTLNKDNSRNMHFIGSPKVESSDFILDSDEEIIYHTKSDSTDTKGFTTIYVKKDEYKIQSKDIKIDHKNQLATFLTSLTITDPKDSFIKADQGNYNIETEILNLKGAVQFIGEKATINSQILSTEKKDNSLYYLFLGDPWLKIKEFNGTGNIIKYNKTKSILQVQGNVVFKNPNNGMILTCHSADINEKRGTIYFYNNVYIKSDNKSIRGKLGMYDEKTDTFTITGDVMVNQNGSTYYSDKASYHSKTGVIEMTGNIKGASELQKLKGIEIAS